MTNHRPIRVMIADDHPVVRSGISGMLANQSDFVLVGEAENGFQAVERVGQCNPDVVLMDLRMPLLDGLQALIQIRQRYPTVQVLILTTYDRDADIQNTLQAGAIGYLLKDAPREELYHSIRAAAQHQTVLNPAITSRLVQLLRKPQEDQPSEREIAILELVSQGLTNREIGKQLHISEATVKTHLLHIFAKLAVGDRAAAVRKAIELGLLTLSN